MNKKQLLKHEKELNVFIRLVKVITITTLIMSLILYGISINSYFKHEFLQAVLLASLAFSIFHILRRYVVSIAKYFLKVRGGHDEMLQFIEEEMLGKSQRDFFELINKAMQVIKR